MRASFKHFDEYKKEFEENAVKTFESLDDATKFFSVKYNVDENEAKKRIENNTNGDWIVSPTDKVYIMSL